MGWYKNYEYLKSNKIQDSFGKVNTCYGTVIFRSEGTEAGSLWKGANLPGYLKISRVTSNRSNRGQTTFY
jgi:hypothetical protein